MIKISFLGGAGCLSGYLAFQLWHASTTLTANTALELFGLCVLMLVFLWNSLSHLLVDVAINGQYRRILRFVARFGSPRARRIALAAALLSPTPAYASQISDHSPNLESYEYSIQTAHSTPPSLRRVQLKPAVLNTSVAAQPGITVQPGDSLWSIAQEISPDYPNVSIAQIATNLWENNRDFITDPNIIYPGQYIQLPSFRK
ncbi:LysM peptidoglycan-binding domain-containing protein [Arcanobacterium phocae]|uniref:LysM peptidoglycan-binding domain-containing protein n=1 Tax=Arcanobacterium phocae TaxID=131112 RepID=UPI001C0ECF01|nr:LysM peptidoglycan-binding domain-containing protein [Arcanobacterium phocae]